MKEREKENPSLRGLNSKNKRNNSITINTADLTILVKQDEGSSDAPRKHGSPESNDSMSIKSTLLTVAGCVLVIFIFFAGLGFIMSASLTNENTNVRSANLGKCLPFVENEGQGVYKYYVFFS